MKDNTQVNIRDAITESILYYSDEKYQYPIQLPPFIVKSYHENDPFGLVRMYTDFRMLDVRALDFGEFKEVHK